MPSINVEINGAELAVIIAEKVSGQKRPKGAHSAQAFIAMDKDSQKAYSAAASAALEYIQKAINKMVMENANGN